MKTTLSFTSTFSPKLIEWLDRRARAQKRTRRAVLEEAIRYYQRELTRESLKAEFKRAARDQSIIELAEWGMSDYSDIVARG